MKPNLLVIDDEPDNLDALERLFRKKFNVLKASAGETALNFLKEGINAAVIICDQRMPQMSGVEFLEKSIRWQPDSVRILLTGYTDIESVIAAINSGQIYRYVTKPWDPRDLEITVDRAFERYQLQKELKEKNVSLATALRELETLDEAKSHFMILIGHELKTPLTSLLSFAELLNESKLDDEQSRSVTRILKSANRLKEIVIDVLDLTSAESGVMPINLAKVDLLALVDNCSKTLLEQAKAKSQEFEISVTALVVEADPKILENVLKRILHNAIKFGEPNSKIRIYSTEENSKPELHVINVGPELTLEIIEKILKPFALNENIMNHSKGLGLGLSLCQALLKRHGLQLMISSKKNENHVGFSLPNPVRR